MTSKSMHSEWLSLVEVSGPFLAEPVLKEVFPQGLEGVEPEVRRNLRQAYDEWREALDLVDPEFNELHKAWVALVLREALDLDDDVLKSKAVLPESLKHDVPEHGLTLRPDYAVFNDENPDKPSMLITVLSQDVNLENPIRGDKWATSPAERMVELCRATGVRLGLLTNGERWMLVDAPIGAVTSFASWYARLWGQEPVTLQAFVNLLGVRRFFLDQDEQLPALLDRSIKMQDEVTDALGVQVQRAVEVLIQALDREDATRNRELLKGIKPSELYEAGLTVMMRIVFLLSAEERGLLLMGDEGYETNYAVSTLRMQLRENSDEILERRWDAWSRLLAIFRAVYAGIEHDSLRMPALGGSLFDPDRFPFLEGRAKGTNWLTDEATPLPIDNRTVLLLLEAVQLFQGRTLSYRALDVEQIGYVYEGLLERTAIKADEVTLDLDATKNAKKPWVTLAELEAAATVGQDAVAKVLEERTESSASRVRNDLTKHVEDADADRLLTACQADVALRDRVRPYFHFLRSDPWGYPLLYPKHTFRVATGLDRRETGAHYTPKSLTEAIVKETLEPVVYEGPADGKPRGEWKLKSPAELLGLKICDPAMGSGAFLVQVCRWLSERLLEAWEGAEAAGHAITQDGRVVEELGAEEPLQRGQEERLLTARRLIAERCLYGVDLNPLAVELAKLSIWLITLAKGRPFGFLDHNLKSGDSLLGITTLEQLYTLELNPGPNSSKKLFAATIDESVTEAIRLRTELRQRPILDIKDVEVAANLDRQAKVALDIPALVGDAIVGDALAAGGTGGDPTTLSIIVGEALKGDPTNIGRLRNRANEGLTKDLSKDSDPRRPFHWVIEFSEVFCSSSAGFDAIVGNPPFAFGKNISAKQGSAYNSLLVTRNDRANKNVDLVAHFFFLSKFLCKKNGVFGFVSTSTIAEGKTREAGLDSLVADGYTIKCATSAKEWPGKANVHYCTVVMCNGAYSGDVLLNEIWVKKITTFLTVGDSNQWHLEKLHQSKGLALLGAIPNGRGFIIDGPVAKNIIGADRKYENVILPYTTGEDINAKASSGRYIICFWDWPLEKCEEYPLALSIVKTEVFPHRLSIKGTKPKLFRNWWLYEAAGKKLHSKLGVANFLTKNSDEALGLDKIIATARISRTNAFDIVDANQIFAAEVVVFLSDSIGLFSVLQSNIHTSFAWEHGGKMKADLRYSPSLCLETFPFCRTDNLSNIGSQYLAERSRIREKFGLGLTNFYNRIHNSEDKDPEISLFRELVVEMDQTVLGSYGWEDIDLVHSHHKVAYLPDGSNSRFTFNEHARKELLERLTKLNKVRHEAEYADSAKPKSQTSSAQPKKSAPPKVDEKRASAGISDFFAEDGKAKIDNRKNTKPEPPAERLYNWLYGRNGTWVSRAEIMAAVGLEVGDFDRAIDSLVADDDVMRSDQGGEILFRAKG